MDEKLDEIKVRSSVNLRARIIPPNPVFELYKIISVLFEFMLFGVLNKFNGIKKR